MTTVTLETLKQLCEQGDAEAIYAYSQYQFNRGELDAAMSQLRRAAQLGHKNACITLAKLLIHDVPYQNVDEAFALLEKAPLCNLPERFELMAMASLRKSSNTDAFMSALEHLRSAADLNVSTASASLKLLDSIATDRNVDPRTDENKMRPISADWHGHPVSIQENALSTTLCSHIIQTYQGLLRPSMVVDPRTGQPRPDPVRRSKSASIDLMNLDFVTLAMVQTIANKLGTSINHCENLALIQYDVGDEYRYHCDFLVNDDGHAGRSIRACGQRTHTVLIYLNEDFHGGETDFRKWNVCVPPKKGQMIMFKNVHADGSPDWNSVHCGKPILQGKKWLLSVWFREKPYLQIF